MVGLDVGLEQFNCLSIDLIVILEFLSESIAISNYILVLVEVVVEGLGVGQSGQDGEVSNGQLVAGNILELLNIDVQILECFVNFGFVLTFQWLSVLQILSPVSLECEPQSTIVEVECPINLGSLLGIDWVQLGVGSISVGNVPEDGAALVEDESIVIDDWHLVLRVQLCELLGLMLVLAEIDWLLADIDIEVSGCHEHRSGGR